MGFGHFKTFLDRSFESGDGLIHFTYANSSTLLVCSSSSEIKKDNNKNRSRPLGIEE